jgi:predicted ribosome quality control (RQC) complex YloA/Tae2 family protein
MEIEIDFTKSAQDNASDYYQKSKKLASRKLGAEKAINDLKKGLDDAIMRGQKASAKKLVEKHSKEWYEKFRWFFTSNGMLVLGGRDKSQNEALNSKHFGDNDIFFHANIFGGSVTILKDGLSTPADVRAEVAQFAGCNSSAWKEGLGTIDVYAMRRDQVSKSTSKGSLGSGSFLLSGEREWYRDVQLGLVLYIKDAKLYTAPTSTFRKINDDKITKHVYVGIGRDGKSEAAKKVARILGYEDLDHIMQQLPAGNFRVSQQ